MLRRLPILIVPLLCTSCFTFFTSIDEPADAGDSQDMRVADGDGLTDSDIPNLPDIPVPDIGGPDTPADVDMDMGEGALTATGVICQAPHIALDHPALQQSDWLGGGQVGSMNDLIGFSLFTPAGVSGSAAEVAWIQDGRAQHARVELSADRHVPTIPIPFGTPMDADAVSVALGPSDVPTSYTWAVSGDSCAENSFWWGGTNGEIDSMIPCSAAVPTLDPMEIAGGLNHFRSPPSVDVSREIVWQDRSSASVIATGGALLETDAINAPFDALPESDHLILTTAGPLVFMPDASRTLHAWNITQPPSLGDPALPEDPPLRTTIGEVERGSIDVLYLQDERYVVARVQGSEISIELWEGDAGTGSNFSLIGEWHRIRSLVLPHAVELAAFEGGFVLWYEERGLPDPENPNRWSVHPFEVDGNDLRFYDCPYRFPYADITYLDNDLGAVRVGRDLHVVGAVHFESLGTQYINVEGPYYTGLFPP